MSLLITRPQADAKTFAEKLSGMNCLIDPMLTVHIPNNIESELEHALKDTPQAVIVTSKHALEGFSNLDNIADIICLAVGARTGAWAEANGMNNVTVTGENVSELIDYVITNKQPDDGALLYLSGRDISTDLSQALGGFIVNRIITYEAELTKQFKPETISALTSGQITGITFFTPRSVQAFMDCVETDGLQGALSSTTAYCLSEKVAESFDNTLFADIKAASNPTVDAMVDIIQTS